MDPGHFLRRRFALCAAIFVVAAIWPQLGRSQPVPEGQQDHGCIPMPMPVLARRLHQPLDLSLGEVLTDPIMAIGVSLQWLATGPAMMLSLDKSL